VPRPLRIGVVTAQGDFGEHIEITRAALDRLGLRGDVVPLRSAQDAESVDAAIIPGGESTTISKLLVKSGALRVLRRRIQEDGLPVLGTCAGAILLAKEGDNQVAKTDTQLLAVMDVAVDRNAFGRQRESFETDLRVVGERDPVHAVFIRGPAITRVWGKAKVLAKLGPTIVAAHQGNLIALAFHPEIAGDPRFHVRLLQAIHRR